jgi:hypothetical protein
MTHLSICRTVPLKELLYEIFAVIFWLDLSRPEWELLLVLQFLRGSFDLRQPIEVLMRFVSDLLGDS